MNENKIIETLKYISQFVKNGHDEGLGDYLHIVIGRTDINVIDETIHLLERKQKEIVRYKKEIEEKSTIIMAGAEKVKQLEKKIEAKEMEHQYDQNMIDDLKGEMVHDWIHKDKIRRIINKYVDIDEHLKYNNQELYGEDLKNMINELL